MFNKDKIKRLIVLSGVTLFVLGLGTVIQTILTTKSVESIGEGVDGIDMYDDIELYQLTHNEDGSLNAYGEGLE